MKNDLFPLIEQEFKKLKLPIRNVQFHTTYNSTYLPPDSHLPPQTIEFIVETTDKEVANCLEQFATSMSATEVPFRSFEEMESRAIPGLMTRFDRELCYAITMSFPLEDNAVFNFIRDLREKTKPLIRKIFEQDFDKEVDNHLSEDEYNKGNDGY